VSRGQSAVAVTVDVCLLAAVISATDDDQAATAAAAVGAGCSGCSGELVVVTRRCHVNHQIMTHCHRRRRRRQLRAASVVLTARLWSEWLGQRQCLHHSANRRSPADRYTPSTPSVELLTYLLTDWLSDTCWCWGGWRMKMASVSGRLLRLVCVCLSVVHCKYTTRLFSRASRDLTSHVSVRDKIFFCPRPNWHPPISKLVCSACRFCCS